MLTRSLVLFVFILVEAVLISNHNVCLFLFLKKKTKKQKKKKKKTNKLKKTKEEGKRVHVRHCKPPFLLYKIEVRGSLCNRFVTIPIVSSPHVIDLELN